MTYRTYDHVERLGHPEVEALDVGSVYVFPKLDGTNACVWWDYGIKAGSRNREISLEKDNHGFMAWLTSDAPMAVALREFCEDHPHLILYGEWLVPHSLKTYREDTWRRFWIFDVYSRDSGKYLPFGVYSPMLPEGADFIIPLCTIDNPSQEQLQSQVAANTFLIQDGAGVGEGIVLKNYEWQNRFGRQPWAKLVRNEFKEQNRAVFGVPKIKGESVVEFEIAMEFCTAELVGKTRAKVVAALANALKEDLCDPNTKVHIETAHRGKLIPQLLGRVYHDLIVEELWEALKKHSNPTIDFKLLNKHVVLRVKTLAPDLF